MQEFHLLPQVAYASENSCLVITQECTNCGACEVVYEEGFGIAEEWAYLKELAEPEGWHSQACSEAIAGCPAGAIVRKDASRPQSW